MASPSTTTNEIRTRPAPECLLCGSPGGLLYEQLRDRFFGAPGLWRLVQCPNPACGLAWLDPMPLAEDMGKAYENYFTHASQQRSLLWQCLFRIYQAADALPARLTGLARERQRMDCLFLDDRAPGRLLDVGCGDGQFLAAMRLRGWQPEGLDSDPQAVRYARSHYGLTVHEGELGSAGYAANAFDAVTLRHVIEHVPDPRELLRECHRLLKPGGRLVVATPNLQSRGSRIFGRDWMNLDPPRHVHLFTPAALEACARQAGWPAGVCRTTAANAEVVFTVSLSLRTRGLHRLDIAPRVALLRPLRAVLGQYREWFKLKTDPRSGEEIVLLLEKSP